MKYKKSQRRIGAIILIAIVITPFLYVQINKVIYDQRVTNYLIDVKGYKTDDIKSVKGVWGVALPPFLRSCDLR